MQIYLSQSFLDKKGKPKCLFFSQKKNQKYFPIYLKKNIFKSINFL